MTPTTNAKTTPLNRTTLLPTAAFEVVVGVLVPVRVPETPADLVPLITVVAADVATAPEPDEVAAAVGISEIVTPALAQRDWTAGASSRLGLLVMVSSSFKKLGWMKGIGDVLSTSLSPHFVGAHDKIDSVIAVRPVVHWHFTSVTSQPEPGIAATKQGSYFLPKQKVSTCMCSIRGIKARGLGGGCWWRCVQRMKECQRGLERWLWL